MYTDIQFENASLNPNVRSVAMLWGLECKFPQARPLVWYRIVNCGFLWQHPLRIDWRLGYSLKLPSGRIVEEKGAGDAGRYSIKASIEQGGGEDRIRLLPRAGGEFVESVLLMRNGKALLEVSIPPGEERELVLARKIYFVADLIGKEGLPVIDRLPRNGRNGLVLDSMRSMRVTMKGGEPGPKSGPIHFIGHGRTPW